MDRTIIAPYRVEEKELSEKLHKKLEGLMLLHPPNEELKKWFSNDMFLKTNHQAFFQVMHYLLRIHDATEFKKRFYWPITDKRSESYFRSATVEYLKHLSEKHSLNWNVKSYLVQMPGGMKFIIFLIDLITFVIAEQIRICKKQLNIEIPAEGFSELDLKRLQKKHEYLKDYTAEFINAIEEQSKNLRIKTQLIKSELSKIEESCETNIDKHFLNKFDEFNERTYEEVILKQSQKIISFEKPLSNLKQVIEKYQQKATEFRKDRSMLRQAMQKIIETTTDVTPMNSMIEAFVKIHPTMETWLGNIVERNSYVNRETTLELIDLKTEFEQIESQVIEYQKKFNSTIQSKGRELSCKELTSNFNVLSKYVFTPPIKGNTTENTTTRLPLQGESNTNSFFDVSNSARKTKPNTSFDLSTTLNRSKIVEPVRLLRTIYKDKNKKSQFSRTQSGANLSLLGLKWKDRQQMICSAEEEKDTSIKFSKGEIFNELHDHHQVDIKISSPKTPFNAHSGDITRIALSASFAQTPSPMLLKSSVVKKVQEYAMNIQNLSTSPTGRLDPLYTVDEVAIIKSNNDTVQETDENNANLLNIPKKLAFDFNITDEDSIFNTSDTVLKDIA